MQGHIASVSWGDHLTFGEGDGRLATPDALARRMDRWRAELGARAIHWRMLRRRIPGTFHVAPGRTHPSRAGAREVGWDDFEALPRLARDAGLDAYLYISLFDEGWPLAPPAVRRVSYHNAMHGQHASWESAFNRAHPEYAMADRTGRVRQRGVLCLAYPEVRAHFIERWLGLLNGAGFTGLFVCLRSQSRPADIADQFGFNPPVRDEFQARHGRDILAQDFDLAAWRDLLGEYLTRFLRELRQAIAPRGLRLTVGAARGDVLGPPLGNATLAWRTWVRERLVDALVINQNSSRCPSMWHDLWPMHRGYGYRQNYLDSFNLPPLRDQIASEYAPLVCTSATRLYVARQWDPRSAEEESALMAEPGVSGLVFSTFRFDNPGPIDRGDWTR